MSDLETPSLREDLEIRVIALLTGELPEAEADELEKILAVDEELSAFRDRMATLMGDVHAARDEITPPTTAQEMKLSEERRRAIFKNVQAVNPTPKEDEKKWWHLGLLEIAAMLLVGAFIAAIAMPALQKVRSSANIARDFTPSSPELLAFDEPDVFGAQKVETFALETSIPEELIEGTPMPINIPEPVVAMARESAPHYAQQALVVPQMVALGSQRSTSKAVADKEVPALGDLVVAGRLFISDESDDLGSRIEAKKPEIIYDRGVGAGAASEGEGWAGVAGDQVSMNWAAQDINSIDAAGVGSGKDATTYAYKDVDEKFVEEMSTVAGGAYVASSDSFGLNNGRAGSKRERLLELSALSAEVAPINAMQEQVASPSVMPVELEAREAEQYAMTGLVDFSNDYGVDPFAAPGGRDSSRSKKPKSQTESFYRSDVYADANFDGLGLDFDGEQMAATDAAPARRGVNVPVPSSAPVAEYAAASSSASSGPVEAFAAPTTRTSGELDDLYDSSVNGPVGTTSLNGAVVGQLAQKGKAASKSGHYASNSLYFASADEETEMELGKNGAVASGIISSRFAEPVSGALFGREDRFKKANTYWDVSGDIANGGIVIDDTSDRIRVSKISSAEQAAIARNELVSQAPKPEKQTEQAPVSTFSLNVSDVSFKLAQAALASQRIPSSELIRTEEFVNSFTYGDPAPRENQPVTLNWEIAQHPYQHDRQIVRFSLQTQAAGRNANQPLNLNLLVDNSGSMQRPDRRAIMEQSLKALQSKLTDRDQLNVVLFSRQPKLIANASNTVDQKMAIEQTLNYQPEGGTNLESGLEVAYSVAQQNYDATASNRVILMTDGAANLGEVDAGNLAQTVIDNRKQGIALDAYGIGWEDYNDALLEEITRNGDGRYAFLNDADTAAEDFAEKLAGTLRVSAADVKVQILWNPERVKTYRQIGYDLHQLKEQDFRDNYVDAAEIGEAESGTALYVVQLDEDTDIVGGMGTLQVRYRVPATGEYVERAWQLEMPHNIPNLQEAEPSLRLAASSALFAERLANNPFASNYSFDDLEDLTRDLPEAFPTQPRVVELQNMIQSANSLFTHVE